ncbi:hypothetical protein [Primorskyibacter flagellatus]|uniref:hypothetical protein n=1 Tax=Primorskyibacter flagellatus TaxID=1387277 RepID=UPI003A9159A2
MKHATQTAPFILAFSDTVSLTFNSAANSGWIVSTDGPLKSQVKTLGSFGCAADAVKALADDQGARPADASNQAISSPVDTPTKGVQQGSHKASGAGQ